MNGQSNSIPVVDVDNAFPAMVERPGGRRSAAIPGDLGPQVEASIRDVLGWRPRPEDPAAFTNALNAAFRLTVVEGHVESEFVPRGYAVQADLGAVTGGQASLYRRARLVRGEALRILDGLVPLRADADADDMESYRLLVRNAVERVVDEMGAAGGPRVQMVNMYLAGLTGTAAPTGGSADTIAGQLGALRDRFGLVDANVNTVEEEGVRTAYWTLVDLVTDLQGSWNRQVLKFTGASGQGFLGTELILLSRLMEAAADQVEEVEDVLDSVLVSESERRTLVLDPANGLTLDGLLTWIRDFLTHEGRRLAQDAGRDGIVSALAPMLVEIVKTFKTALADRVEEYAGPERCDEDCVPVTWLPASCCERLPAGLYAARSRIAVAGLCRLLLQLARTAQRVGRWAQPVALTVGFVPVDTQPGLVEVQLRGLNMRLNYIPGFVPDPGRFADQDCRVEDFGADGLVLPMRGSATADDESITGVFRISEIAAALRGSAPQGVLRRILAEPCVLPAEVLPLAIVDGELGRVVHAPTPVSWPGLQPIWSPYPLKRTRRRPWPVPTDEHFVPADLVTDADRDPELDDTDEAPPKSAGGGRPRAGGWTPRSPRIGHMVGDDGADGDDGDEWPDEPVFAKHRFIPKDFAFDDVDDDEVDPVDDQDVADQPILHEGVWPDEEGADDAPDDGDDVEPPVVIEEPADDADDDGDDVEPPAVFEDSDELLDEEDIGDDIGDDIEDDVVVGDEVIEDEVIEDEHEQDLEHAEEPDDHVEIDKAVLEYLSAPEFQELMALVAEHELKTEVNKLLAAARLNIQIRKA